MKRSTIAASLHLIGLTPAEAAVRTFNNPTVGGHRLDFCVSWKTACGKPAADRFCQARRYDRAVDFRKEPNVGLTKLIGSGQVCSAPFCSSFAYIRACPQLSQMAVAARWMAARKFRAVLS